MTRLWKASAFALAALSLFACEEKAKTTTDTTATPATTTAADTTAKNNADTTAKETTARETAAKETAPAANTAEDGQEVDPAATSSLEKVDFKGKAPEGFEIKGKVEAVFGWTDRFGTNAVVITTSPQKGRGEEQGMLMLARHATQNGDGSWDTTRELKELVKECPFDIHMDVKVSDAWSVTDLDKDGLGEATIAYSAGCRSDVSPVSHKVLMIEDGKKYALRGDTRIKIADASHGGEYKADFDGAPESFLPHAKSVWEKTVDEKF